MKWREGSEWQSEKFPDLENAEWFKQLVEAHYGPDRPGWVRGERFVEPKTHPDGVPLLQWAHRYVDRLTHVDKQTKSDYWRDVESTCR